eukprot:TRINITY_DN8993_c0_g1_i1.p1 TRINITY_DN8993_c0_g1~~TRINITY_DN8993_c0_g1_i1.p1  ORF type:complete len:321 (+),score=29.58 TRINITY_DN8993_c0_g1_i1:110-1072(+)
MDEDDDFIVSRSEFEESMKNGSGPTMRAASTSAMPTPGLTLVNSARGTPRGVVPMQPSASFVYGTSVPVPLQPSVSFVHGQARAPVPLQPAVSFSHGQAYAPVPLQPSISFAHAGAPVRLQSSISFAAPVGLQPSSSFAYGQRQASMRLAVAGASQANSVSIPVPKPVHATPTVTYGAPTPVTRMIASPARTPYNISPVVSPQRVVLSPMATIQEQGHNVVVRNQSSELFFHKVARLLTSLPLPCMTRADSKPKHMLNSKPQDVPNKKTWLSSLPLPCMSHADAKPKDALNSKPQDVPNKKTWLSSLPLPCMAPADSKPI